MDKTYYGKTLLCRANYEGKSIPGRISFSPERIDVKLVGFEDFVYFKHDASIALRLEDNQYCTVTPISTSPGSASTARHTCHYLTFDARQVILGFRPWEEDDRVKEFHFKLSNTNGLLDAPDIRRRITVSKLGDLPDATIIEARSGDATVTISYSYSFDWRDDNFSVSDAHGSVEFAKPKSVAEVSKFVAVLRTFFTMAAAIEVRTGDYWLVPDRDQEQPLVGGGTAPASFQLIWPTGQAEAAEENRDHQPTSVLRCFEEVDRKSTSSCLTFWMENWATWNPAFSGLLLATREGNIFDTSRILNACKWLESTPDAKQLKLDNKYELKKISEAAIEKACDLGLDLSDRILGAISQLRTESRNDLLKRLIDLTVQKDDPLLKERFLKDIHKAFNIRGRFAHSKFDHTSNDEFGDYVRCTQAVEALAFFLLYRKLPLPADHHWGYGPNNFTEYLVLPR
ncbi:hypothetical protein KDD17_04930 [Sulfitobacter albidus]|uniref:ApeA N-terminal domain-containing protein n=1 Tax=Sulfitobacter albidus TaxID=2829501 RepID=A0A975JF33_9RHOB|nr:hypothetical protein [Sulfitobacter albidus]QUJ77349.1 hypothetical protein KDD17_04930 [Sulfitobacter albidus]